MQVHAYAWGDGEERKTQRESERCIMHSLHYVRMTEDQDGEMHYSKIIVQLIEDVWSFKSIYGSDNFSVLFLNIMM